MRAMDQVVLPRSRLALSRLGMGCAQLGGLYHDAGEQAAMETVDAAWELGLRYFDTAPYYGFTLSEHRLGAALSERPRDQYAVSTKAGRVMRPDQSVAPGDCGWARPLPFRPHYDYSYDGIMRSHDDSLQRLGLEHVDILFVHDIGELTHDAAHAHYWDQLTHGGGFRALESLRSEGRVSAIGLGVNESAVVQAAMQECDLNCTLLAGRYTLLEQGALELLDACARNGNAIIIGGAFNSGILAGTPKFDYGEAPPDVVARAAALAAVCGEYGVSLPAAALQFPMAHRAVAACITGAHDATQLRQNARWFEQPIPAALWYDLKQRGLLDERAPVPGAIDAD